MPSLPPVPSGYHVATPRHRIRGPAMGHNPSRYTIKRLSAETQHAVDDYKARSVWSMWWMLDEAVRRRYFTHDERRLVLRYGARLDEVACHRSPPRDAGEEHFLRVCVGEVEPRNALERLWLLVQLVCRYHRVADRAARADLAEHDATTLRAENRALKAEVDHLERYAHRLANELQRHGDGRPPLCNVVWMSLRFAPSGVEVGPAPRRFAVRPGAPPVGRLTQRGLVASG